MVKGCHLSKVVPQNNIEAKLDQLMGEVFTYDLKSEH